MKKDDLIKTLRENTSYNQILSSASDDAERRLIKAHAENFMLKFFKDVIEPMQNVAQNDPDALNKYLSKVETELINSGSLGQ